VDEHPIEGEAFAAWLAEQPSEGMPADVPAEPTPIMATLAAPLDEHPIEAEALAPSPTEQPEATASAETALAVIEDPVPPPAAPVVEKPWAKILAERRAQRAQAAAPAPVPARGSATSTQAPAAAPAERIADWETPIAALPAPVADREQPAATAEMAEREPEAVGAEAVEASSEGDLAGAIESVLSDRRYANRVEPESATARPGSGQLITGNSLMAELAAAREARGGGGTQRATEDFVELTRAPRSLLDRVLAFGGIALILVVAFLALAPSASQYGPVARLTNLFN
jgi:hypothetical protein